MSGLAAGRDASWFRNPSTHGTKVLHAATDDGFAACNPKRLPLVMEGARPASETPAGLRCRRPACRVKFADASLSSGGAS